MKTREFHLTQMPSTLARQLEIDRSLFGPPRLEKWPSTLIEYYLSRPNAIEDGPSLRNTPTSINRPYLSIEGWLLRHNGWDHGLSLPRAPKSSTRPNITIEGCLARFKCIEKGSIYGDGTTTTHKQTLCWEKENGTRTQKEGFLSVQSCWT